MTVYVIAEFGSTPVEHAEVARLDRSGIGPFGERMLADTSRCETLTGGWTPKRIAVLEFPTMDSAKAWWAARERSAPTELRDVERKMILVDGL